MNNTSYVFGIIGLPASGKGTVAEYLKSYYRADTIKFSDMLRKVLEKLEVEASRDKLIALSEVLRDELGQDILAHAVKMGVDRSDSNVIVIDGVRREGDIEIFKQLPNFHLIGIDADIRKRYERSKVRGEKPEESTLTFEAFEALEQRSTELTAKALLGKADLTLDNNGSFNDLYKQIDQYVETLGIQKV
ncbi:AAA family ATPase [Candidatus Uhrbacteria bacterium]|nr:AAA family ATPase [Candidatus Uhrbacteria bacterium]MBD3284187.1 AAA family ATPase [Candidatus Uhrbacteria bacterium]